MKRYRPAKPRRPVHRRAPAFVPVPLRGRRDGWTPARQARFLGALAETRSVLAAARKVGMARETAYRLRRRAGAESFAAAWDAALGWVTLGRRKVTHEERVARALFGLVKPVMYGGRHVATVEKADNSALLAHIARIDRAARAGDAGTVRSQDFVPCPAPTSQGATEPIRAPASAGTRQSDNQPRAAFRSATRSVRSQGKKSPSGSRPKWP
jgi:hypothetical protein